MADKLDDKSFLQRWSARKLDADNSAADVAERAENDVQAQDQDVPEVASEAPPPDLPDVDALDADSDYSAFLGENVPQKIADMALRKLWRSDPVLANIDGLNDYDEDFSMVGKVAEVVKTAYQAGQGYLTEDDLDGEEASGDDAGPQSDDTLPTEEQQPSEQDEEMTEDGETADDDFRHTENPKSD